MKLGAGVGEGGLYGGIYVESKLKLKLSMGSMERCFFGGAQVSGCMLMYRCGRARCSAVSLRNNGIFFLWLGKCHYDLLNLYEKCLQPRSTDDQRFGT